MKKKRTVFNILLYVGILAVVIVTFILVTTFQNAGNFVDAYIAKTEISSATTINNSTFEKYFTNIKYRYEDKKEIEDKGGQLVTSVSDISGKTSISKIPVGTIILRDMFEDATSGTGLWNSEIESTFDLSKDDANEIEYITLRASKENAPANSFYKNQHLIIENTNAIEIPSGRIGSDGNEVVESVYGVLVNKALLHTVYKDSNGEISNVGLIVTKDDAKNLSTLQDQGISFKYIEGKPEDFPVATWTKTNIYSNILDRISNNTETFVPYVYNVITGVSDYSPYIEYTEDSFGFIEEYTNNINLFWYGNHSKAIVNCYDLKTGLRQDITESGVYSRTSSDISKKLIYNNSTFETRMPEFAHDGYYEISILNDDETEEHLLHFIKNSQGNSFLTSDSSFIINFDAEGGIGSFKQNAISKINYSFKVQSLKNYENKLIFNEDLKSKYTLDGENIYGKLNNVPFFVPKGTVIATYGSKEFTAKDTKINSNPTAFNSNKGQLFYEYEEFGSAELINYSEYSVKTSGSSTEGLSSLFSSFNKYELESLIINMNLSLNEETKVISTQDDGAINDTWLIYILTGTIDKNSLYNTEYYHTVSFDDINFKVNFA